MLLNAGRLPGELPGGLQTHVRGFAHHLYS